MCFLTARPLWPSSVSIRSSVCWARVSTEVKAISNDSPCAFNFSPASLASAIPLSVRSGSFQPVKRFFRFHSLWPCLTSTRSRSLIFLFRSGLFLIEQDLFGKPVSTFPDHALKIAEPEYVGHRIQSGLAVARPECCFGGALREHGAVFGPVGEL